MTVSGSQSNVWLCDPDVQRMLRVRDGDDSVFPQLVENYQDRLIGIFAHMLRDRQAAEDLAQDVFLRVYRARKGYTPTAKFSTWLFRIANNLASNKLRYAARRREVTLKASESGPLGLRPEEQLISDKFEHMSYVDIAAAMDLSVQAVKSLLSRARGQLRTQLEPYL
jgi:RNA polymerase sigma-70 factor, ECF subfamily